LILVLRTGPGQFFITATSESQRHGVDGLRSLAVLVAEDRPINGCGIPVERQGDIAVFGADAQRANRALGNPAERAGMEGFVAGGPKHDQIVTFKSFDAGYIGLDDWSQLDPAELLALFKSKTETENQLRRQQGVTELHLRGQRQFRARHWQCVGTGADPWQLFDDGDLFVLGQGGCRVSKSHHRGGGEQRLSGHCWNIASPALKAR
jgi:hypothetical protein